MKLIDASGKEWSFEFCFWHSKDSRIYYFKKFYPYVQSTDLRGGDTGALSTFSSPRHFPSVCLALRVNIILIPGTVHCPLTVWAFMDITPERSTKPNSGLWL